MKTVSKINWIKELLDMTEKHLTVCVRELQNLPEASLNQRSADGGWCVGECLYHLVSYGNHYLPLLEEALGKCTENQEAEHTCGFFGAYFIGMMKKTTRYKAHPKHLPPNAQIDATVVATFIDQLEHYLRLLRKAEILAVKTVRIRSSISILVQLKLLDAFSFLVWHHERHLQQALRVMQSQNQNSI